MRACALMWIHLRSRATRAGAWHFWSGSLWHFTAIPVFDTYFNFKRWWRCSGYWFPKKLLNGRHAHQTGNLLPGVEHPKSSMWWAVCIVAFGSKPTESLSEISEIEQYRIIWEGRTYVITLLMVHLDWCTEI
jgi:hypothetical protein